MLRAALRLLGIAAVVGSYRCGDYELLGTLARGGMAELLLARPIADASYLVVIKRALPEYAHAPDFVRMLLDEARIAASLHHRNVVRVHAVGDHHSVPYLVMELLLGEDLNRILARLAQLGCRLPLGVAIEIAIAICAGLHHAHERRDRAGAPLELVHRDVSPQNVFLTYDGAIKVLDFGIARTAETRDRTRAGIVKGKVAYMSPEQAHGRALDRRSDIFSVGILLWEMTTCRRLYARPSELETLKAVCDDAPRPSTVVANYPAALEAIVMRCLARDPGERWATCEELAEQLAGCARDHMLQPGLRPIEALMRELFTTDVDAYAQASRSATDLAAFALARAGALPVDRSWDLGSDGVRAGSAAEPSYVQLSIEPPATRRAVRRPRRTVAAIALTVTATLLLALVARYRVVDADVAGAPRPASSKELARVPIVTPIDPPADPPTDPPLDASKPPAIDASAIDGPPPIEPMPSKTYASKPSPTTHRPSSRHRAQVEAPSPTPPAPPAKTIEPAATDVPINDRIPVIALPTCPGDSACATP